MNTLFPVYIYEEGLELPSEGTYYLVSGNGLWLHKDTGIVSAFIPVDNISVLEELNAKTHVDMNMPKLPAKQVYKIKKFFQEVVALHHAESATILYYNKRTNEFKIQVTDQSVSHGGVNYKRIGLSHTEDMGEFLRVGTIHSHCDFGAFHSGTDIGDEEDFDGLHCTFGHNDKDEFTITASIVVNGHRLAVDPMTVLEGIQPVVKTAETSVYKKFSRQDDFFLLETPSEDVVNEWESEKDQWMSHVKSSSKSTFSWLFKDPIDDDEINEGSKVTWSDTFNHVKMKTIMGDGPFDVLGRKGDRLIVNTKIGKASLSVKLFKKEE